MPDSEKPNADVAIGPPPPSGADFYLPKRGSESLDAAKVAIKHRPAAPGTPNRGAAPAVGHSPAR